MKRHTYPLILSAVIIAICVLNAFTFVSCVSAFLKGSGGVWTAKGDTRSYRFNKPVIYLYGYEGEDVEVSVSVNGKLRMTYPMASNGRWKFRVDQDSMLDFNGKCYRYLFWDADVNADMTFNKGYCVAGSNTRQFLENKLDDFGFTDQEKEDFLTYWVPYMQDNPYNVISFQTKAYTDAARLTVTPKPDKLIRIFMAWYPSNTMVTIPAQNLKIPARSGRTVVEWGGSEIDPPLTAALGLPGTVPGTTPSAPAGSDTSSIKVPTDPYAIYGEKAQCAKDWDSSSISKSMGKWASISEGLRADAWYHYSHYGKQGW